MSVNNIGIREALLSLRSTAEANDSLTAMLSTGKKVSGAKDDPIAWVKINQGHSSFTHLESIKDSLNETAMGIRIADQSMHTITTYIDQMKASLMRITKFYPPYPPGSDDRIRQIRSFNSFRRIIDQLTVPPENEAAKQIMADPSAVPEAGPISVVANDEGFRITISPQQVHTGSSGINIPEVPEDASDAEIDAAIENLSVAAKTLADRRARLGQDAAMVSRFMNLNGEVAGYHRLNSERLGTADSTEVSAEIKSAEVRRTLALESVRSLTGAQSLLVELLR